MIPYNILHENTTPLRHCTAMATNIVFFILKPIQFDDNDRISIGFTLSNSIYSDLSTQTKTTHIKSIFVGKLNR